MLNELRIRAFWACALWIEHLLTTKPSGFQERLEDILDSKDFIHGLATLLYSGTIGTRSKYYSDEKNVKGSGVKPDQLIAYEHFLSKTGLPPLKEIYPGLTVGKPTQMLMISVQAALRSHYRNAEFDVDKPNDGTSSIDFFFTQNATAKKYVDFPTSSFSPRAICLSEHCLLDILWSNAEARDKIIELLGLNKRTKATAEDKILRDKGVLFKVLFSLKGYRGVGLQSDEHLHKKRLRPSFFTNGLTLILLAYDTSKFKKGRGPQAAQPSGSQVHASATQSSQVIQPSNAPVPSQSSSAKQGYSPIDLIGSGGNDGTDDSDDEGDVDGDEDLLADFDDIDWLEVDEAFIGGIDNDEGDGETAGEEGASSVSTSPRSKINWKQRSRLLENVEVMYDSPTVCPNPENTVIIGIDPGET
ncbi:hypothetical protein BGZ46_005657, partial [Entomortierella lignicola]